MRMIRPAWKIDEQNPGSDLAGETAAAFAAASILFKDINRGYSDLLLHHGMELYEFAYNYRGRYSEAIDNAAQFYK